MVKVIKEVLALLWRVLKQVLWQRIKTVALRILVWGLLLGVVVAALVMILR